MLVYVSVDDEEILQGIRRATWEAEDRERRATYEAKSRAGEEELIRHYEKIIESARALQKGPEAEIYVEVERKIQRILDRAKSRLDK